MEMEAEIGVVLPQATRNTSDRQSKPPEARKEGQTDCPQADGRNQLYDTRIQDFCPPIYRDNILLLFKPSSLWCFVTVALAN